MFGRQAYRKYQGRHYKCHLNTRGNNMKSIKLPEDYALVLQQVGENGEENMDMLAESLRVDRRRLAHIIQSLHHKGLIYFADTYQEPWIRLSTKGKQFVQYIWPESKPRFGFGAA